MTKFRKPETKTQIKSVLGALIRQVTRLVTGFPRGCVGSNSTIDDCFVHRRTCAPSELTMDVPLRAKDRANSLCLTPLHQIAENSFHWVMPGTCSLYCSAPSVPSADFNSSGKVSLAASKYRLPSSQSIGVDESRVQ